MSSRTELQSFLSDLRSGVRGEVLSDSASRFIYGTDASLYQMIPQAILLPKHEDDVRHAVLTASRYGVSILPRGGGTSLAGQTVGTGLVIDFSKYLNRVVRINLREEWVLVEPGIVLDVLNEFLGFYGYFFAPDVATSNRANVGGMIGNNSCGTRSVLYGKTVDHVHSLSVICSNGQELELGPCDPETLREKRGRQSFEGRLYDRILDLVAEHRDEIEKRYPKIMRHVGGYNLDYLASRRPFNLASLIVGSEGTLAITTRAKLKITPLPKQRSLAIVHYSDLLDAIDSVRHILQFEPSAVEILDRHALSLARDNPAVAELRRAFIKGEPEAVLLVEFSGTGEQVERSLSGLLQAGDLRRIATEITPIQEESEQAKVWRLRKSALGVLLSMKSDAKPLPFIEDAAIPVENLSSYITDVLNLCRRHGRSAAMYAHASVGVIHVRPILNLKDAEDVRIFESISGETFKLVQRYAGAWAGEHGDGLVRSYKNREFFGSRLYECFRAVKSAFDPEGLLNPGKIIDSPPLTQNLRLHPGYSVSLPETYFRFEDNGGFDRAVEMCTGIGHCRKTQEGTMCPSFMATRDEEHSTRGRANALRAAISGQLGPKNLAEPELHRVLDLCLECKACKTECPSNVDMARLKAEFLAHYHNQHGTPLFYRMVGKTRPMAEVASRLAPVANFAVRNRLSRWLLERVAGVDRRRRLPAYAARPLSRMVRNGDSKPQEADVVLFVDTFTNYYDPEIGLAALDLLSHSATTAAVFTAGCCGRPLISAGMLVEARRQGDALVGQLEEFAAGRPILTLEPSCFATLKDDFSDLVTDRDAARHLARQITTVEEFLVNQDRLEGLRARFRPGPAEIIFHGHCQQKAVTGTEATTRLLGLIPDSHLTVLDAGCCGMAGSFGYQKGHYAISEKIGARRLFPAVRKAGTDTLIAASGFSCRHQIAHFTSTAALHPVELIDRFLLSEFSPNELVSLRNT